MLFIFGRENFSPERRGRDELSITSRTFLSVFVPFCNTTLCGTVILMLSSILRTVKIPYRREDLLAASYFSQQTREICASCREFISFNP